LINLETATLAELIIERQAIDGTIDQIHYDIEVLKAGRPMRPAEEHDAVDHAIAALYVAADMLGEQGLTVDDAILNFDSKE